MGGFASKYKSNRLSARVRGQLLQLKSQRDELEHYILLLENNVAQTIEAAVSSAKENQREHAILLLRKRDLLNSQISTTREYLMQILTIISDIEVAQTQADVVKHLETGSKLLSMVTGKIKAAKVHKLMQIQADNIQELDEVTEAFKITGDKIDDSLLLQELDALVAKTGEAPVATQAYETRIKTAPSKEHSQETSNDMVANAVEEQRIAVLA